jgi:hypothetical protein
MLVSKFSRYTAFSRGNRGREVDGKVDGEEVSDSEVRHGSASAR